MGRGAAASPSTVANDLGWKRELYQRLGIQEYWRFDPTGGDLYGKPIAGERLVADRYEEYELQYDDDGSVRAHSELLDVVFHWNGEEFDVLDPATGLTIDQRAAAEARADAAEAELARLRAQLRQREP